MYEQTLYKILKDHIKPKVLKRMNRYKKWEYGYNKEHDIVIISKDGTIGDIYEIQNLKIACLLYTSPSPRDRTRSRMPSSA